MSEQDRELAEATSSTGGAMEELANALSGKTPPLVPAERRAAQFPVRPNKMAKMSLGFGIVSLVCVGLMFTPVGCFGALGMLVFACLGLIFGVTGLQQVRLARSGRGMALCGLILSLITVLLTILLRFLLSFTF